ncbi:MAG: VWA domain-containing protein [Phycisphaerae bacterium]
MKSCVVTYRAVCTALALSLPVAGLRAQERLFPQKPQSVKAPQIEVCFVLDTTGSMGGLIAGAKAKIWSIANQMISAKPTPKLRIGLIGYRDRGDQYVTKVFDLTEDIDAVYGHLQEFQAAGGGDTPESVNQALAEAVTKISWNPDKSVLKIIFLVGDCPPHMDYPDDVKYQDTCQAAVKKDLIINAVQCGSHAATTPIWREIARLAEGSYVAIGQTGDMQIVTTPMDKKLAELNVELGKTLLPYGEEDERDGVRVKQAMSEAAEPGRAADRLAYNAKTGKVVQGGGDLVDAIQAGEIKLDSVKKEHLLADMQSMSAEQRREYVKQKADERRQLQTRINELLKQRQVYIGAEMRRLMQEGQANAFDTKVAQIIREQARRKGIEYGRVSTTQSDEQPEGK